MRCYTVPTTIHWSLVDLHEVDLHLNEIEDTDYKSVVGALRVLATGYPARREVKFETAYLTLREVLRGC